MTPQRAQELLSVTSNASGTDLKNAYQKQVFKWHPDRNKTPEAARRLKDILEAYKVLSEPTASAPGASGTASLDLQVEIDLRTAIVGGSVAVSHEGKTCSLVIPVRTAPGTWLRVPSGAPDGRDLRVLVSIKPHEAWDVRGIDLAIAIEIPASLETLLVEVPLPDEEIVKVSVAPNVPTGAYLLVPRRGLQYFGDLYVFIRRAGAVAPPPNTLTGAVAKVLGSTRPRIPVQKPQSQPRRRKRS